MKFKFYKSLLFFSLFPVLGFAQDFDQAFLASLPNDVRSDLIKRSEEKNISEAPQYRRSSTFVQKPNVNSKRFGAKVFSLMQTTMMPINEPNFDDSYFLDFGDQLQLQLIGQESSISKLNIQRDGSINIEDIGKIFISGLSLKDATALIKSKINESFIGVDAFVTLINIRDIQVILAGSVYNPGTYTLNGNSNIFHALNIAGGPSEFGSFRSIDLVRNNKILESIDLYQTFIFAKSSFKTRLRSGDIVFVNPVRNIVTLNGAFKRTGDYELLDGENLSSAIFFGNGITKYADLSNIKLERVLEGKIKPISIVNVSQFKNIKVKDGDSIFVRSVPFRSIEVVGAVVNPGSYRMSEGDTIFDAISTAGGYTKNAYPFGGVYENESTKKINLMAISSLYKDFLDSLLSLSQQSPGGSDFSSIISITEQLKNTPASGRVVADFINKEQKQPILIQDGDKITIPEYSNQIYIYGEVSSEGPAIFKKGENIEYYLAKKGGLTKNANLKSVYILQPNGETKKIAFNKNIFNKQAATVEISSGSIIFIPRKATNNYASVLSAQAYAAILGNVGVTLASLAVLK